MYVCLCFYVLWFCYFGGEESELWVLRRKGRSWSCGVRWNERKEEELGREGCRAEGETRLGVGQGQAKSRRVSQVEELGSGLGVGLFFG